MSDVLFFSKLNPRRLTSLEEDFKAEQKKFLEDEKQNSLRKAGKQKIEPIETTYERDD